MKVYLDNCCLQRPLDDKRQVRVQLEAEAVLAILTLYEAQKISLVSSEVLEFELAQNPDQQRKVYVEQILSGAALKVVVNDAIASRAKELEARGFRGMDAVHLACAEAANVDYFCSCDDRLLRRAQTIRDIRVRVVSLLELAGEIVQ